MDAVFTELKRAAGTLHLLAPYQHTPLEVVPDFVAFCGENLREGARVVEVGSGDARLLIEVARSAPVTRLEGFEVDEEALSAAREALGLAPDVEKRIEVYGEDVMESSSVDWKEVTFLFMYLTVAGMARLWPFFCSRLQPGTKLVSIQFRIPGVDAVQSSTSKYTDLRGQEISFTFYLYETPS